MDNLINFASEMRKMFDKVKAWLQGLSFRTGVIVLLLCTVCYILSFAQMMLPVSVAVKTVLWTVFFGLAKTFQYSAILILGKVGIARLKSIYKKDVQP